MRFVIGKSTAGKGKMLKLRLHKPFCMIIKKYLADARWLLEIGSVTYILHRRLALIDRLEKLMDGLKSKQTDSVSGVSIFSGVRSVCIVFESFDKGSLTTLCQK